MDKNFNQLMILLIIINVGILILTWYTNTLSATGIIGLYGIIILLDLLMVVILYYANEKLVIINKTEEALKELINNVDKNKQELKDILRDINRNQLELKEALTKKSSCNKSCKSSKTITK